MKLRLLLVSSLFGLSLAAPAQVTVFNDTFASGSTINSATPVAPTANSTSYEEIASKAWNPNPPTLNSSGLKFGISSTTGGGGELQALFTTTPVALQSAGDYVQLTIMFSNALGVLALNSQLGVGLFNSGQVAPWGGGLNNAANSTTFNAETGGALNWQGYLGQIGSPSSSLNSQFVSRPAQPGTNNTSQVTAVNGSSLYGFANSKTIGTGSTTPNVALAVGGLYTEVVNITLLGTGALQLTATLYTNNTSGTQLTTVTATTGTTPVTNSFDAFSIGWRATANTTATTLNLSSVQVTKYIQVACISANANVSSMVSGQSGAYMSIVIPASATASGPLSVDLVSTNAAVAYPDGASSGTWTATFPQSSPYLSTNVPITAVGAGSTLFYITNATAGACISATTFSSPLTVSCNPITFSPTVMSSIVGQTNQSVTVSVPASANQSGAVTVDLQSLNPSVAVPQGATGDTLTLTFPAAGTNTLFVPINALAAGTATLVLTNNASAVGCSSINSNATLVVTVTQPDVTFTKIETFDTLTSTTADGWLGSNNRSGFENYGWTNDPAVVPFDPNGGEAGGIFVRTNSRSWYGDTTIGMLTLNDYISATGRVVIVSPPTNNLNVYVTYFNTNDPWNDTNRNFLGVEFTEGSGNSTNGRFTTVVGFADGTFLTSATGAKSNPPGTVAWDFEYDPTGGPSGNGQAVCHYSNSSGSASMTNILTAAQRAAGASFNAFGLATRDLSFQGAPGEYYLENVTYTINPRAANLTWNSTSSGVWDVATTANWLNQGTSSSDVFEWGDMVLFGDSLAGAQTNIALEVRLGPGSVTVNSTNDYSITGPGKISGTTGLTKNGNGTLLLGTTNDFAGPVAIQNGAILIQNTNALGAWTGAAVSVTGGGTLDIGGLSEAINNNYPVFGARQFNIAGAGVNGNGALVNSSALIQESAFEFITLTADATIGGSGRWDLRNNNPVLDLAGHNLTKTGPNDIQVVSGQVTSGNIQINQGSLTLATGTTCGGSGTITVNSGGALGHYRSFAGAITRPIVLNGGALTNEPTSGTPGTNDAPITLAANSILGGSSGSTYSLILNGAISESNGPWGLTILGAGPVVLTGAGTYSGATLINAGTFALAGSGSIGNSASINVSVGAMLDVSGRTDDTLTLGGAQILSGGGGINGAVVVAGTSAVVHPGGGGASATTLTVTSNLTFSGSGLASVVLDLSGTYDGPNDQIVLSGDGAVLTGNSTVITINSAGSLDTTQDYVLFNLTGSGASIAASSFAATPLWSGTTPKYASAYSIVVSGTQVLLHFTPVPLTVTAVVDSRPYDGTTNSSGIPTVSGALESADTANFSQAFSDRNVGNPKTLIPSGTVTDGNGGNNYAVTFVNNTGVIGPRLITVTAVHDSKQYDGTTNSAGVPQVTSGSLVSGDSAVWMQAFADRNAGTGKTLNPAGVVTDGNGGLNYTVTFVPDVTGAISAKPITVTAATNTKPYDGNVSAAATPSISPALIAGDTANFTETYDTAAVGTGKTLTPTGSVTDGNGGNNYAVTFATDTTGVINAKTLTVTGITADNKVYDGTNTASINTNGAALVGIVSGDDVTLLTNGYGAEFASSGADTNIPVTVTNLTLGGANATDYSLAQPAGLAADITPAPLTVTGITAQDKVYDGGTNATLNLADASLAGVLDVDLGNVTLDTSGAVGAFSDPAVGNDKPVTISGLTISGSAATNYSLTQPVTTASITPASVPGEPFITGITVSGGNVTVIGTNVPASFGHTYYLVTSDSLMAPESTWLPLATNGFAADGGFTNTVPVGGASQFYLIQVPLP